MITADCHENLNTEIYKKKLHVSHMLLFYNYNAMQTFTSGFMCLYISYITHDQMVEDWFKSEKLLVNLWTHAIL
jgi:hypothetical protein